MTVVDGVGFGEGTNNECDWRGIVSENIHARWSGARES